MRRLSFQSQVPAAVDGFGEWDLDAFLWGEWHSDELGDLVVERPPIAVVGTLRRRRSLSGEEFAYARGRTDRVLKVTLPSPSLFANFYDPERSREAYPTLEAFLEDVAEILREEVDELVALGATYIQLDAPHYPLLARSGLPRLLREPRLAGGALARPRPRARQPRDRRSSRRDLRLPPLPRQPGEPLARRGRLRLARRARSSARVERRSASCSSTTTRAPAASSRSRTPAEDTICVLGLVTTKTSRRETVAELAGRIREAATVVPLERLALSPQCGFATSVVGNALTSEDERAKLATIAETAAEVWG